jgi:riboflavin synthase
VDKPPGTFKVALIPHTLEHTIAGGYNRGSIVNLEADVVARYVARNLRR